MIFAVLFDMSIKCTVRTIRHTSLHTTHAWVCANWITILQKFTKLKSKICQAYKTCSFIKYKSKNIKCARVCKQCQEHCLMTTIRICLKWKVLVSTKHITKVHTPSVPYIKEACQFFSPVAPYTNHECLSIDSDFKEYISAIRVN